MKKKVVGILGVMCAMTAALGMCMSVAAAPKTMVDGQTFDPQFYAKKYPAVNDLAKGDETLLYAHYVNIGKLLNYLPYENATVANAAAGNVNNAAAGTLASAASTVGISSDGKYTYKNNIFNEAMKYENSKSDQCFMKVSAIDTYGYENGEFQSDRQWLMHITSPRMKAGKHYATVTDKHGWDSNIPATTVDFYQTFGMDMKDAKNNWDASMRMMAAQGFDINLDSWGDEEAQAINENTIRHTFYYKGQCAALQNLIATIDYDEITKKYISATIDQHIEGGVTKYYNFSFLDVCVYYTKNGKQCDKYISYTP